MNVEQLIEVVWGVAVADAIGNKLEFVSNVSDVDILDAMSEGVLYPTDDTQMTLFNYEALLNGWGVKESALAWYRTQTYSKPKAKDAGLASYKTMYRREAPGITCCSSCFALASGSPVFNESKGNGTVMRASPFAVMAALQNWSPQEAFLRAKEDALVTHKHPFAWMSSVLLVAILLRLFSGQGLKEAIVQAYPDTGISPEAGPDLFRLVLDRAGYKELLSRRSGWVAEEALAMALGANLYSPVQSYTGVVSDSYKGADTDSDTVGSIAGAVASARGMYAPDKLRNRLYSQDAIVYITDRLKSIS